MKRKKRQPSGSDSSVRNDLLSALLNSEYKHLSPKLEQVDLKIGEIIYKADQRIDHVYFPETAVVAMIDTVDDGSTVEVGIIGHEGMVGINIFLGCLVTPDKAIVQISGSAMRMKTSDLRKELRFGSPLQRLLLRYTQVLLAVISQSVACSQHHSVSQRLARWLLTMHDHAESNQFVMSQASIAAMLGVRRVGVTHAAGKFQAAGLMTYSRARIHILDEAGLKKKSCECYRFMRQQFDGLLRDVPGFLSGRSGISGSRSSKEPIERKSGRDRKRVN
jgi:CRP-like cAMP-binding protein